MILSTLLIWVIKNSEGKMKLTILSQILISETYDYFTVKKVKALVIHKIVYQEQDQRSDENHFLNIYFRAFDFLAKCPTFDLRLLESIYIHKLSPNLNNHNSSCPLNILN